MIDRFFTLALAAGLLALAVSTVYGISQVPIGPRMVEFERVLISGKRALIAGALGTSATGTAVPQSGSTKLR